MHRKYTMTSNCKFMWERGSTSIKIQLQKKSIGIEKKYLP